MDLGERGAESATAAVLRGGAGGVILRGGELNRVSKNAQSHPIPSPARLVCQMRLNRRRLVEAPSPWKKGGWVAPERRDLFQAQAR